MPDNSILSRLDGLKIKYEEIGQQMTDPEVIADVRKFIALNKEYERARTDRPHQRKIPHRAQ